MTFEIAMDFSWQRMKSLVPWSVLNIRRLKLELRTSLLVSLS